MPNSHREAGDGHVGRLDRGEIQRALRVMLSPNGVHEVRCLGADRQGTISGYFDYEHREFTASVCADFSGVAVGVYVTLNPVRHDLLARANNRCIERARHTSADSDVLARRWLALDFDPVRPSGISSTDAEHSAALDRARECRRWLRSLGIPSVSLVLADSGNGAHLLVRIKLPNSDETRELSRVCLEAAAFRFSDADVHVDQRTFNAARIWKVYGTLACKGDCTVDRPYRLARLLSVPKVVKPVERRGVECIAATLPSTASSCGRQSASAYVRGERLNLSELLRSSNIGIASEKDWQGGRLWVLDTCPWDPTHVNRSAFVIQFQNGAVAAGCHHDSCRDRSWRDLRETLGVGAAGNKLLVRPEFEGLPPAIVAEFLRAVRKGRHG